MMLSDNDLKTAIQEQKIKVEYYFLYSSDKGASFIEKPLDANNSDWAVKSALFLEHNIIRNRLGITAGALIKSINGIQVPKQYRWNGQPFVHDLRKGPYKLQPEQTVVILTNEKISTDAIHAAFIFSRVSHFSRGLSIHPTYIQSSWEGILKIQATNISKNPITIELGQPIGGAFFFNCSSNSSNENANEAHHHGLGWNRLLSVGGIHTDPFADITTQEHGFLYKFKRFYTNLKSNWSVYFGDLGMVILMVLGIVGYFKITNTLDKRLDIIQNELLKQQNLSGIITLSEERKTYHLKENLPAQWIHSDGFILTNLPKDVKLEYYIDKTNEKKILNLKIDKSSSETSLKGYKFQWVLLPQN